MEVNTLFQQEFSAKATSLRVMTACRELMPSGAETTVFLSSPITAYLLSIARHLEKCNEDSTLTVGHVFATAAYCAPEQVLRRLTQQECPKELSLLNIQYSRNGVVFFTQFVNELHCAIQQVRSILNDKIRWEVQSYFSVLPIK